MRARRGAPRDVLLDARRQRRGFTRFLMELKKNVSLVWAMREAERGDWGKALTSTDCVTENSSDSASANPSGPLTNVLTTQLGETPLPPTTAPHAETPRVGHHGNTCVAMSLVLERVARAWPECEQEKGQSRVLWVYCMSKQCTCDIFVREASTGKRY